MSGPGRGDKAGSLLDLIVEGEKAGILSPRQAELLTEIQKGELISLRMELQALLYAGVLFLVGGIGAVVAKYFQELGHPLILGSLGLGILACQYLVSRNADAFSQDAVPSPNLAFDYILLLEVLLLGLLLSYTELHFHLLGDSWRWYLLGHGLAAVAAAYRYDNRLVLSLGLSTLVSWYGLTMNLLSWGEGTANQGLWVGALMLALGILAWVSDVKRHFHGVYLVWAQHLLGLSLLYKVADRQSPSLSLACLLVLGFGFFRWGLSQGRFPYCAFAVIYSYVALMIRLFEALRLGERDGLALLVLSGIAVIAGLLRLRKHFLEEKVAS